jgi:hypothetical protein
MDKFLRYLERMIWPVAILTGALGIAYWYWTTTPSYALTAVVVSVKNRDVDMFEKYVDVDSVSGEILGRQSSNSFIGMGFVRFFKRELVELAHGKIDEYIEAGNLKLAENVPTSVNPITALAVMNSGQIVQAAVGDKKEVVPIRTQHESKNEKLKRILKEYGISKFGYKGVKYLRTEGPKAYLGLEFFAPKINKKWVAEFQLEDAGGYYKVMQLDNLNDIVDMYMKNKDV